MSLILKVKKSLHPITYGLKTQNTELSWLLVLTYGLNTELSWLLTYGLHP